MSVGRKRRSSTKPATSKIQQFGLCDEPSCGKVRYGNRRDAKRAAKKFHPGDHLSAYECGDYWHFGHPPRRIIQGLGWGDEVQLDGLAKHVQDEAASHEPTECEGCSRVVEWTAGLGYAHGCEVIGEDEVEDNRESE